MSKKISYELLSSLRDELNAILGDATEEVEAPKKSKKSTAASAEDDFDSMSYNDLKKMCKAQGLSAAGNREELIARLNGEDDSEEEEKEPVKKSTVKKPAKKTTQADEEDEEDDDDSSDDEEEEEEEESIQDAVEAATEDMSLEELAEFCEDNGLSSKGKRQALIARIVKAVEAGDIELFDEDEEEEEEEDEKPSKKSGSKKPSKKKEEEDDEDDEDGEDEEGEPTAERVAALKAYKKDTKSQFKKGELERDDLIEFLCDFHEDKDKKAYKKMSDDEVLDAYIEASSNLINDEGEIVEEGAYTVNGVPFCCGRPLVYNEDEGQYVCEHCGGEYEADEE